MFINGVHDRLLLLGRKRRIGKRDRPNLVRPDFAVILIPVHIDNVKQTPCLFIPESAAEGFLHLLRKHIIGLGVAKTLRQLRHDPEGVVP
ncbi:hypothetical protein D1872_307120 [compost metagenome]